MPEVVVRSRWRARRQRRAKRQRRRVDGASEGVGRIPAAEATETAEAEMEAAEAETEAGVVAEGRGGVTHALTRLLR